MDCIDGLFSFFGLKLRSIKFYAIQISCMNGRDASVLHRLARISAVHEKLPTTDYQQRLDELFGKLSSEAAQDIGRRLVGQEAIHGTPEWNINETVNFLRRSALAGLIRTNRPGTRQPIS